MHGHLESSALLLLGVSKSLRYDREISRITSCIEATFDTKVKRDETLCIPLPRVLENDRTRSCCTIGKASCVICEERQTPQWIINKTNKENKSRGGRGGHDSLFYCLMGFFSIGSFHVAYTHSATIAFSWSNRCLTYSVICMLICGYLILMVSPLRTIGFTCRWIQQLRNANWRLSYKLMWTPHFWRRCDKTFGGHALVEKFSAQMQMKEQVMSRLWQGIHLSQE